MSWRRVKAIVLQNLYVVKHSPIRVMELVYWPLLEVVLWGYITLYLARRQADIPGGVEVLLGAVLLWDVLFRSQQELSITALIDQWDKNVVNLNASPMRQSEYFLGGLLFSSARVVIGSAFLVLVTVLAFDYNLLSTGAILIPAFLILVGMGWALALVIRAMVQRYGSNADVLAWSLAFLFQPVSAVFYPVDVLPGWLQAIARVVPASHVFEALRAYLERGAILAGHLLAGAVLDILYLAAGAAFSVHIYRRVRVLGLLGKPGY